MTKQTAPAEGNETGKMGRVLLLGDDMRIFLALARSLGRAGMAVHAAPPNPGAPALASRYVGKIHTLPPLETRPAEWITALRKVTEGESIDLVIPCGDPFILMLDEHRDAFGNTRLAIPPRAAMDRLFDKQETHEMCQRLGIPVAQFIVLDENATPEKLAQALGFPFVLKPTRSYKLDRPGNWGRVHIVMDMAELQAAWARIEDKRLYAAEAYFEGAGCGISVLANHGRITQAFQHRRLREGWGGSSSYRISELLHPEMLRACELIMADVEHTGVCMFEFRMNDASGRWIMLETNARFWGSMPLPLALGIPFPVLLHGLLVKGEDGERRSYKAGVRSRNITLDAFNLLKAMRRLKFGGLTDFLSQPLRWITGREVNDSFATDDLAPALCEILSLTGLRR